MKVLLLTATYPPSANGVSISVYNLFNTLKKLGHEPMVFAPNIKHKSSQKGEIRYPSMPNPMIKDYPIPMLPITPEIIKILFSKKFDIVHAHHPFYIGFFADVISTLNNIPMVFTYHTRYDEYAKVYMNFIPKKLSELIIRYSTKNIFNRADVVVVPSRIIANELKKTHPNIKFEVIPTGIPEFSTPKEPITEVKKQLGLPLNKKLLLSTSRLAKEKNITLLLRSLLLLPKNFHLVLVGTGQQYDQLIKLSKKFKIGERVTFPGRVPHDQISKYYYTADIFVFPSFTETQGLCMLEASYYGLPIVAVDCEVNGEWVLKQSGFLVNNNPKSFSEAILNVHKLKDYKSTAKKWASKYTIENTTKKFIALYKKMVSSKR